MKKYIFVWLIFILEILHANSVDDFNNIIVESSFNEKLSGDLDGFSFNNLENSKRQEELKKLFEKVLPFYLNAKDIFTEDLIVEWNKKENKNQIVFYARFFTMVNVYIRYLQDSSIDQKLLFELSKKALDDTTQHIRNVQNYRDYHFELLQLVQLYEAISNKSLLKKYPPPTQESFIEKIISGIKNDLQTAKIESCSNVIEYNKYDELKEEIDLMYIFMEKELDTHFQRVVEVIKDPSSKNIKEFDAYMNSRKEKFDRDTKTSREILLKMKNIKQMPNPSVEMKREFESYKQKIKEIEKKKIIYPFLKIMLHMESILRYEKNRQELVDKYNEI